MKTRTKKNPQQEPSSATAKGVGDKTSEPVTSRDGDGHQQAVSKAIERICRLDYPPTLLAWLRERHPSLHNSIFEEYPDRIEDCWNKKVPLIVFESVLTDWFRLYQATVTLFREETQRLADRAPETWAAEELEIEARTRPSATQMRAWAARRRNRSNS